MRAPDSLAVAPESFVVRVYRRDARMPARIAGTVEVVASGRELSFRNLRELQSILVGAPRSPPRHS